MSSLQHRPNRGRTRWDEGIPPILRPLIRAYILGYGSVVAPKVVALMLRYARKHKTQDIDSNAASLRQSFLKPFRGILSEALEVQRFPTFCAALVGGTTLLEVPVRWWLFSLPSRLNDVARRRLARWLSSFVAAWLSVRLLQSRRSSAFEETLPSQSDAASVRSQKTVRYAGRTLDLSLFAFSRALDVVVGELWARRRSRRVADHRWNWLDSAISKLTDPVVFATSSALIMWCWFYSPSRLPRTYNRWISSAAAVDLRLIEALQRCRRRELRYGEETGQAPLLQAMCADYKWPLDWGDPAKTIPFPCEMVHMGCGPSCEYHAFRRFYRSFRWSMATYLPLNLLLVARNPSMKRALAALLSAARSSAFLGAFITFFYYGVCLARTRLGPHIIGMDTTSHQRIDEGICVGSGCFFCGWSILLEAPSRRKDISLFVAPRAMASLLPRKYSLEKQWRETLLFAFSTATVFTCVLENPRRVRGVLGGVLGTVLSP